ncbi:hypothetical protein [Streptomyces syringium]|uniref:hypothetical protein n=1 Tax=Streptomyces syringium TaxID=76729 RepID=UPI0034531013
MTEASGADCLLALLAVGGALSFRLQQAVGTVDEPAEPWGEVVDHFSGSRQQIADDMGINRRVTENVCLSRAGRNDGQQHAGQEQKSESLDYEHPRSRIIRRSTKLRYGQAQVSPSTAHHA